MPLAENCLEERAKASAYHIQTLLWLFYLSTRHCVNLWTGDPRVPGSMALGACGCEHRQQLHSVGAAREEWGAKGSGVREGNPPEGEVCVCGGVGVKEHLRAEWRWRKRWSQASSHLSRSSSACIRRTPTHTCAPGEAFSTGLPRGCVRACTCVPGKGRRGVFLPSLCAPFLLVPRVSAALCRPCPGGPCAGHRFLTVSLFLPGGPPESLTSSSGRPDLSSGLPTPDDAQS